MKKYHVSWTIELPAESPEEAAKTVKQIQLNPFSTANIFNVSELDKPGEITTVDLSDFAGRVWNEKNRT